jgi:hypothetical protein
MTNPWSRHAARRTVVHSCFLLSALAYPCRRISLPGVALADAAVRVPRQQALSAPGF